MMDPQRLLVEQIPERYVAGRLSPEEIAEFEEYLLENPAVIEQVELARQLKLGLRTLSDRGMLAAITRSRPAEPRRWLMAAAAAMVVLAGALFIWVRPTGGPVLSASLQGFASSFRSAPLAGEYLLARTRSTDVTVIARPARAAPIQVKVQNPGSDGAGVDVALLRGTDAIASLRGLRSDVDGLVTLFLDTSMLADGDYLLRVSQGDAVDELPFRLRAATP